MRSLIRRSVISGAVCAVFLAPDLAAQPNDPGSPERSDSGERGGAGEGEAPVPAPAPADAAEDVSQVSPPVLLTVVDDAAPKGIELSEPAFVDLSLTINDQGDVVEVEVVEAPRTELRAPAVTAARAFRFQPATVAGKAVAVVVGYRYWFVPADPKTPVAGAEVPQGEPAAAASEAPASESEPQGRTAESQPEAVPAEEEVFEAVAEADAPPREPTRREVTVERLVRVPGTRGDALRAVETLPGVARAPQGANPIIRGSAQFESATFVDGTHLPLLYHFGGVTSVVPSRLLEKVELYPGNFSARYGRVSGGIIEARLKEPNRERFSAVVDVNLIDTGAIVETPIGDDVAVALGARRSNIDFVFESFVPDGTFNVVAAPLYWDYQNIWSFDLHRFGKLRVAALGTRDQLKLIFDEPSQVDPMFDGNVSGALEHHRLQLRHELPLGQARQTLTLTAGKDVLRQRFGTNSHAHLDAWVFDGRGQWDVPIGRYIDWSTGFDVVSQFYSGAYLGSSASQDEGSGPLDDAARSELRVDQMSFELVAPALWTEAAIHATSAWTLIPGFRADYYHHLDAVTLNPRLSSRYALTDNTTLKSGVGFYSQAPVYYESLDPVGNPEIDPSHSLHASAGIEQTLGEHFEWGAEAFYKYLYDRIVSTEGGVPPLFINDGQGRVYGLETSLDYSPRAGSYAMLSYTLSRSERQDRDDAWRLFDQDQTHVLSVAASQALGSGWELGARFRYVSGNPLTPIDRVVYDTANGGYIPTFGGINSERDGAFHQLDIRGEKKFTWDPVSLAVYLDIQNVYNRQNPEGYSYSYDYSKREQATGMPFFPNLGLRGEL